MSKGPQRAGYRSNLLSSVGGELISLNEGTFQEVPEVRSKPYLVDNDGSASPSKSDGLGGNAAGDRDFRSLPFANFDSDRVKTVGVNGAAEAEETLDFSQLEREANQAPSEVASAGLTRASHEFSGFAAAAPDVEAAHVDPATVFALRKQYWKQQVDEILRALSACNAQIKAVSEQRQGLQALQKNLSLQYTKLEKRKDEVDRRKEKREKERERDKAKQKEANSAIMALLAKSAKTESKDTRASDAAARRLENKRIAAELTGELDDGAVFEDELDVVNNRWSRFKRSVAAALMPFRRMWMAVERYAYAIDFMRVAIVAIEARFGVTYSVYFDFLRWNVLSTAKIGVIWLVFFLLHALNATRFFTSFTSVWTSSLETVPPELVFPYSKVFSTSSSFWPSSLLVSSFGSPNFFAMFLLLTLLGYLAMSISRLYHKVVDKKQYTVQSADSSDQCSMLVLGGWDWTSQTQEEVALQQNNLGGRLKMLLAQALDRSLMESLSLSDLLILYTKRAFILFFWLGLLLGGFGVIIGVQFLVTGSDTFSTVVKALAPAVVNAALPVVTEICVKLEKWDGVMALRQHISRLYVARITTVVIQLVVFYFFLVGVPGSLPYLEVRDCSFHSCEDQVGTRIFILYVTDVVVACIVAIVVPVVQKRLMPPMGFDYQKQEFQVAPNVIKGLYQQLLLWSCIPFFPLASVVAPLLQCLSFLVEAYSVTEHCVRPLELLNIQEARVSVSVTMMQLYNGCMAIAFAVFVFVLTSFSFQSYNSSCCKLTPDSKCMASGVSASTCSLQVSHIQFHQHSSVLQQLPPLTRCRASCSIPHPPCSYGPTACRPPPPGWWSLCRSPCTPGPSPCAASLRRRCRRRA